MANRLYQQATMLFILVLTARWLGPDGRGMLATALAWVQFVGTAAGLSLGKIAFQHGMARAQGDWSGRLLVAVTTIVSFSLVLLLLFIVVAEFWSGGVVLRRLQNELLILILLTVPLFIWEDFAFYLFSSRSLLARYNLIVSIGRTVTVVLVVLFVVVLALGVTGAMFAVLFGQAVSGAWTAWIVHTYTRDSYKLDVRLLRDFANKIYKLHPQTLATVVLGTSDVLLLHTLRNDTEAGHYQLAWLLIAVPVFASTAVGNVLYQVIAERGVDDAWPRQARLIGLALCAAVLLSGVMYVAAPFVIPALFGSEFQPSADILIGLLPFGFALIFSNLMTPQWVGRGLFATFSSLSVAIALTSVGLNWVLIPTHGVWGAVLTSWVVAAEWIAMNGGLAIWITFHRINGRRPP